MVTTNSSAKGGPSGANTTPSGSGASGGGGGSSQPVALCASCDRCRARKTKCDGARPCGNCAAKYLKKNKLTSIEGIDISLFECVYSPAKRRGPVPGRVGQARKASEALDRSSPIVRSGNMMAQIGGMNAGLNGMGGQGMLGAGLGGMGGMLGGDQTTADLLQQQAQLAALGMGNRGDDAFGQQGGAMGQAGAPAGQGQLDDQMALQRQMMLQQAQAHQNVMALQAGLGGQLDQNQGWGGGGAGGMFDQGGAGASGVMGGQGIGSQGGGAGGGGIDSQQQQLNLLQQLQAQQQQQAAEQMTMQPASQRARKSESEDDAGTSGKGLPRSVLKHLPLLERNNQDGNRLRSYYTLSVDELFCLPSIPTNEEYCSRLPTPINPGLLPRFDLAALQAARFAEIALGALANNQVALALELSNATVLCLRECVEEPVHPSCMFDVARAYLLHGIFRSFRGDMVRYFKYRRVCLTHLSQLDNIKGVEALLAAISFHDAWAYMVHNASEAALPDIDKSIPPLPAPEQGQTGGTSKYGVSTTPSMVASNPINQMWIQGPPPVFINNDAPALSRSLDALACAIRSCCDQANSRFEGMGCDTSCSRGSGGTTPTSSAVTANQNELCSRNMVLSAFTLLQQHEASSASINKNHGHHLVISAMDAFLEGGDEEEAGGFTDSQIQSLLSVCNTAVEHPLLLHQGGPTYHMVSNAAILLCHLLNGMHANRSSGDTPGEMEAALFEEVLDTFIAVRKLLSVHRRKLPVRLRCHGIPRPNLALGVGAVSDTPGAPFIDLGETLMCGCRGCQGFVLMACSPCVAAERAQAAALKGESNLDDKEGQGCGSEVNEFDKELYDLGAEFDLDDDALLNVLSRIIAT